MEMPKKVYDEITRLSGIGNEFLNSGETMEAYKAFSNALELLPEPAEKWEAYTWLQASLGECLFIQKMYGEAYERFRCAYNMTAPNANPYVLLRVGECCTELGLPYAKEFLLRAYMLAGENIFSVEDEKYYKSIESVIHGNKTESPHTIKDNVSGCRRMSGTVEKQYNLERERASCFYEQKSWNNYFESLETAWEIIPEPRHEYAESFELLMVYMRNAVRFGYTSNAMKWVPAFTIADLSRADVGDREYYVGCVYLEEGLEEEAGRLFKIADEKSKGRILKDKKYKKFYQEWKKKHKL